MHGKSMIYMVKFRLRILGKKKKNNKMILYSNKDPENLSDFCNAI